jgi:membrane protein DedA with SNARE-associated domain
MEILLSLLSGHLIYLLVSVYNSLNFNNYFLFNIYSILYNFISNYGYLALLILMLLESTSLPVPSEVILPLAGLLSRNGPFLFPLAFLAATIGSFIGVLIDYYIGYILGKDIVYKHMKFFHLKKSEIDKFDMWFNNNMALTVFISRLVPVIRTFMSFPAGFAKMNIKDFIFYSSLGIIIWDFILMLFGYYLITSSSINVIIFSIVLLFLILYLIYKIVKKHIININS